MRIATLLIAVVGLLTAACTSGGGTPTTTMIRTVNDSPPTSRQTAGAGSGSATTSSAAPKSPTGPPPKPVHIKLLMADGANVGVGMPLIAFFSKKITDGAPLQQATTVTVNGKKMTGAWYFEYSSYYKNYPIEAHFRLQNPWPAHSHVHVNIPAKGLSAGKGLAFDNSLTSDFNVGAARIAVVSDATHTITITKDGERWGTFPVSLGARKTPTKRGIKVIMEKVKTTCMHDTAGSYYECGIKDDQRLTYDGEYLHSAPWNCTIGAGCEGPQNNIGKADSSNGCTNLKPADAKKLYNFLQVGDIVKYPDADGPRMQIGQGYGDWNISWGTWQRGGLVSTRSNA